MFKFANSVARLDLAISGGGDPVRPPDVVDGVGR